MFMFVFKPDSRMIPVLWGCSVLCLNLVNALFCAVSTNPTFVCTWTKHKVCFKTYLFY